MLLKAEGGDMIEYIQNRKEKYDASFVQIITHQLLGNLNKLHAAGFIHRDIKPENILFLNNSAQNSLILADFGLSV